MQLPVIETDGAVSETLAPLTARAPEAVEPAPSLIGSGYAFLVFFATILLTYASVLCLQYGSLDDYPFLAWAHRVRTLR